jgi:uncharacterized protein YegP (UPF0339 family)
MTRSAQVTHAVSAMRDARAAPSSSPSAPSMRFVVFEDNGGGYRWTIVADGGETLAQSASFGSHEEARRAASIVYRGASLASFEDRSGHPPPINLPARRDAATARDRADAERWLDEGGSFNSKAVTR